EPARIELVDEAAVGQLADRMLGERLANALGPARGRGHQPIARDGLVARRVGAAQREREARATSLARGRAERHLDRHKPPHAWVLRGEVERDVSAHRVADECYVLVAELRDERFEVAVERADHERLGMIAVAVSAKIQTHDAESL